MLRLFSARKPPTITGPVIIHVTVNQLYTATFTAVDADGKKITMNMTGIPQGAHFNQITGEFSWTPTKFDIVSDLK